MFPAVEEVCGGMKCVERVVGILEEQGLKLVFVVGVGAGDDQSTIVFVEGRENVRTELLFDVRDKSGSACCGRVGGFGRRENVFVDEV